MAEIEEQNSAESAAIERLRDRTDELELIISSLTIFALFSIPGWMYEQIASAYTHLSTSMAIASVVASTLLAGVCYVLAACFVVHLMARAYWVGLIGLRTVFPDGIDWSRTPGLGPLSRQYFLDTLPDLDTVIRKTDRLASSLFAVISMLTLTVLWFGSLLIVLLVALGVVGSRFGQTNAAISIGGAVILGLFVGTPLLLYVLDAQLASRVPRLRENQLFAGLIRLLRRVAGLAFPQRLVLPVQLTLQSNTRPVVFLIALALSIAAILAVGQLRSAAWRNFTLSSEFTYIDADLVREGFRSTYYEDMSSSLDRLRPWPRVDSFTQRGSFVRLFLPYQPLRDNLVLEQLCSGADEAPDRVACLRRLWSVSIEGIPVAMDGFVPAERADLEMRGLIGLVPMSGIEPGLRRIEVLWNPDATEAAELPDDRYLEASFRFLIPIAFAPDFEMPLQ